MWRSAFGGDKNIVGRAVRLNDKPYTVAGVMPAGFRYPLDRGANGQVWTAIELGAKDQGRDYDSEHYEVMARLRRGVKLETAIAEMATIQKRVAAQYQDAELRDDHRVVQVERYGE